MKKTFCAVAGMCCLLAIPAAAAVQLSLAVRVPEHLSYATDPARSLSPALATECERKIESRMRLFVGRATLHKPIVVCCYVRSFEPLQTVTLYVPKGLTLMDGETGTKSVGPMGVHGYAQITWRLQGTRQGEFKLIAVGIGLSPATETVRVPSPSGIFE